MGCVCSWCSTPLPPAAAEAFTGRQSPRRLFLESRARARSPSSARFGREEERPLLQPRAKRAAETPLMYFYDPEADEYVPAVPDDDGVLSVPASKWALAPLDG